MAKKLGYFEKRNVSSDFYDSFRFPKYIENVLPKNKKAKILDIGCGFGQILKGLKRRGYVNAKGLDPSEEAIAFCGKNGLEVEHTDISKFIFKNKEKFDFIIMSHVLEHIEKKKIIPTLKKIKKKLLSEKGEFCVIVPNAQSDTGCYWAYEDFTHTTMFTSGSIFYVLKSAGFQKVKILDPKGIENYPFWLRAIRQVLLPLYKIRKYCWNKAAWTGYHGQSPNIFTFEIKVLAK